MGQTAVYSDLQLLVLVFKIMFEIQARIKAILTKRAGYLVERAGIHVWTARHVLGLLHLIEIAACASSEVMIVKAARNAGSIGNAPIEPDPSLISMPGKGAAPVLLQDSSGFCPCIHGSSNRTGWRGSGESCIAIEEDIHSKFSIARIQIEGAILIDGSRR